MKNDAKIEVVVAEAGLNHHHHRAELSFMWSRKDDDRAVTLHAVARNAGMFSEMIVTTGVVLAIDHV